MITIGVELNATGVKTTIITPTTLNQLFMILRSQDACYASYRASSRLDRDQLIGDPDSVVFDCYEHGGCFGLWPVVVTNVAGICLQVSEHGIPDLRARLEIDGRAKVTHNFGFVDFTINEVGKKIWFALIDSQI